MMQQTPLFTCHQSAGAKMVDFGGWNMPLHYGSQLSEHLAVREKVGVFDIGHMNIVDLKGHDAKAYLQHLLANDVAKLKTPGKALYSCMLNETGGVKDDLIVYWLGNDQYRLILNAGTRVKDLAWLQAQSTEYPALYLTERQGLTLLTIQGPMAMETLGALFPDKVTAITALLPFSSILLPDLFVARTGYTGEDGFEIAFPIEKIVSIWEQILKMGVQPCGLGARDTLRLEAGMHLYGIDLTEEISPLESGLNWTIAWEPLGRAFIGRKALEAKRFDPTLKQWVGIVLNTKGVLRNHLRVAIEGDGEGEITSGGYSPILKQGIGFARLPAGDYAECQVELRDKWLPAKIVRLPFVRFGKKCF